jgi:hypothetical protein
MDAGETDSPSLVDSRVPPFGARMRGKELSQEGAELCQQVNRLGGRTVLEL